MEEVSVPNSTPIKIQKLENADLVSFKRLTKQLPDVRDIRILKNNLQHKVMCVCGTLKEKDDFLCVLERKAFTDEDANGMVKNTETEFRHLHTNDIYNTLLVSPPPSLKFDVKATVIHPATPKHIDKYCDQDIFLVKESYADYLQITLPYITDSQFSTQWVYNILEHKAEVERIVYEDPDDDVGFVLLPDLKWDQSQLDNLYCLVLVRNRKLKSLRDLNEKYLPLLTNIRDKATNAIVDKFGLKSSEIRAYFHYQPSYYHLHVHFTHLKFDAPGSTADKAHLLDTVISNIQMMSDYYQKAMLPFIAKSKNKLYTLFMNKVQSSNPSQQSEPTR